MYSSRSETSFVAFWASTNDSYKCRGSAIPFVSDPTFRRAWFAYARILLIHSGMKCPYCGS